MLGDLDPAVLADSQDAVIVQQCLRPRFLASLDDVPEQDSLLDPGRNRCDKSGVRDGHLAFDRGKDADVDRILGRLGLGPRGASNQQAQPAADWQVEIPGGRGRG